MPAVPLSRLLRDPRVLAFLLVWLGLNLLFGKPIVTPSPDELAMAHAYVAAVRSAELGRQVGAAIADEFTKLIVTQQAYSANTKVITTANSMVQDLLNVLR